MRFLIVLCALCLGSAANADSPENVLKQIDNYLGPQTFQDSFKTGDRRVIRMDEKFNSITSEMTAIEEIEALPDLAKTTLRGADGRVVRVDQLTLAEWQAFGGNYARAMIMQLSSYGFKVEMEIADMVEARIMRNGRPARLGALKVIYQGKNGIGTTIKGELTVTNQLPARAQVIVRRENQTGIERVWSLLSFDRR